MSTEKQANPPIETTITAAGAKTSAPLGKVAARRMPPVRRIDRLEESLYWLLWAATLVYLVLWIIGL